MAIDVEEQAVEETENTLMETRRVLRDQGAVVDAAVATIREAAALAKEAGRPFRLVLAGGSTPRKLYQALAQQTDLDFSNWELFFGDERWVGQEHADSNFKMAKETLLDPAGISPAQVFPMVTVTGSELGAPEAAAESYDGVIEKLQAGNDGGAPLFDVVLLGMGDDGHTASLFPGTTALSAAPEKFCVSTWVAPKIHIASRSHLGR